MSCFIGALARDKADVAIGATLAASDGMLVSRRWRRSRQFLAVTAQEDDSGELIGDGSFSAGS